MSSTFTGGSLKLKGGKDGVGKKKKRSSSSGSSSKGAPNKTSPAPVAADATAPADNEVVVPPSTSKHASPMSIHSASRSAVLSRSHSQLQSHAFLACTSAAPATSSVHYHPCFNEQCSRAQQLEDLQQLAWTLPIPPTFAGRRHSKSRKSMWQSGRRSACASWPPSPTEKEYKSTTTSWRHCQNIMTSQKLAQADIVQARQCQQRCVLSAG